MAAYLTATLMSCLLVWRVQKYETAGLRKASVCRRFWQGVLCALPLLLVSAMRWGVGTDFYCTYLPEFRALQWLRGGGGDALRDELFGTLAPRLARWKLPSTPEGALKHFLKVLEHCEPGYRALMELAVRLGGNFRIVIIVTSVIIEVCVFYAVFTQSTSPVLAVYLYVASSSYFLSLNIVRQYVAVSIGLVAVQFIRERRLVPYLVCIAAAMLFHTSAILLLPCYFLCRVRLKPRYALLTVALALAGAGGLGRLAQWLMPRIGLGYYARYFGTVWDEGSFETLLFAINLCILLFGSWYWEKAERRCPYFVIWYNMNLLGTLALALSTVLPLMKRVNYYYGAPQFLLLPEILKAEEEPRRRRVLTALVVLAFAAETYVAVWLYNKNGALPYHIREA